jgi:uncharacterized protein
MTPEDFDQLDTLLDDLRTRNDETPQWEFCEGFMAALICCRRVIPASEYLPVLLDIGGPEMADVEDAGGSFASAEQSEAFMNLWVRRWNEVAEALNTEIERLDDDRAYQPEVMDVRGAVASLPEAERAEASSDGPLPSFAQVWALGFMFAVENWPDEWVAPRDKDAAKAHDQALDAMVALTEEDADEPTINVFGEDGPPSVSESRLEAFADAVWGVYDLREIWRHIGPRVETIRKEVSLGRNDPCHCGSGKKFKKCHGA